MERKQTTKNPSIPSLNSPTAGSILIQTTLHQCYQGMTDWFSIHSGLQRDDLRRVLGSALTDDKGDWILGGDDNGDIGWDFTNLLTDFLNPIPRDVLVQCETGRSIHSKVLAKIAQKDVEGYAKMPGSKLIDHVIDAATNKRFPFDIASLVAGYCLVESPMLSSKGIHKGIVAVKECTACAVGTGVVTFSTAVGASSAVGAFIPRRCDWCLGVKTVVLFVAGSDDMVRVALERWTWSTHLLGLCLECMRFAGFHRLLPRATVPELSPSFCPWDHVCATSLLCAQVPESSRRQQWEHHVALQSSSSTVRVECSSLPSSFDQFFRRLPPIRFRSRPTLVESSIQEEQTEEHTIVGRAGTFLSTALLHNKDAYLPAICPTCKRGAFELLRCWWCHELLTRSKTSLVYLCAQGVLCKGEACSTWLDGGVDAPKLSYVNWRDDSSTLPFCMALCRTARLEPTPSDADADAGAVHSHKQVSLFPTDTAESPYPPSFVWPGESEGVGCCGTALPLSDSSPVCTRGDWCINPHASVLFQWMQNQIGLATIRWGGWLGPSGNSVLTLTESCADPRDCSLSPGVLALVCQFAWPSVADEAHWEAEWYSTQKRYLRLQYWLERAMALACPSLFLLREIMTLISAGCCVAPPLPGPPTKQLVSIDHLKTSLGLRHICTHTLVPCKVCQDKGMARYMVIRADRRESSVSHCMARQTLAKTSTPICSRCGSSGPLWFPVSCPPSPTAMDRIDFGIVCGECLTLSAGIALHTHGADCPADCGKCNQIQEYQLFPWPSVGAQCTVQKAQVEIPREDTENSKAGELLLLNLPPEPQHPAIRWLCLQANDAHTWLCPWDNFIHEARKRSAGYTCFRSNRRAAPWTSFMEGQDGYGMCLSSSMGGDVVPVATITHPLIVLEPPRNPPWSSPWLDRNQTCHCDDDEETNYCEDAQDVDDVVDSHTLEIYRLLALQHNQCAPGRKNRRPVVCGSCSLWIPATMCCTYCNRFFREDDWLHVTSQLVLCREDECMSWFYGPRDKVLLQQYCQLKMCVCNTQGDVWERDGRGTVFD